MTNYKQRPVTVCKLCRNLIVEGEAGENPEIHEQCEQAQAEAEKEERYQSQARYHR